MSLDLHAFLDEFRTESAEQLLDLDTQLLALERSPDDPAPVRAMFLAAHSLKGSAAMMDLADVEALAHAMEDVLARLRDGRQRLDAATADCLFRAIDLLRERVARATPGAAPIDAPITALVADLTATVDLPAAPPPAAPTATASATSAATSPPPPAAPSPTGPCALLVEESPTVRLLHRTLLAEAGFAVDTAADGREALALAGARAYDLVVCGLATRGLRGPDFAATLAAQAGSQAPPCILTCHDEADLAAPSTPGVAARLLTEPPARERLSDVVRGLVGMGAAR